MARISELLWDPKSSKRAPLDVGGKARNLDRLARAGFAVPDFVVLRAKSLRQVMNPVVEMFLQKGLEKKRGANLDLLFYTSAYQMTEAQLSSAIRAVPRFLKIPVAVRSSASVEDSPGHSYAGVFESLLPVHKEKNILRAVMKVFLSALKPRARSYAAEKGMKSVEMAVIVQRYVPAKWGGVVFTVDPLQTDAQITRVELASGGPRAVVQGRGKPISIRLNSNSLELLDSIPRDVMPVMDQAVRAGAIVEQVFSKPQDVEWAFDREKLWLLQSRPITTSNARSRSLGHRPVNHLEMLPSNVWTPYLRTALDQDAGFSEELDETVEKISNLESKKIISSCEALFKRSRELLLQAEERSRKPEFKGTAEDRRMVEIMSAVNSAYARYGYVVNLTQGESWFTRRLAADAAITAQNAGLKTSELVDAAIKAGPSTTYLLIRQFPRRLEKIVEQKIDWKAVSRSAAPFENLSASAEGSHSRVLLREFSMLAETADDPNALLRDLAAEVTENRSAYFRQLRRVEAERRLALFELSRIIRQTPARMRPVISAIQAAKKVQDRCAFVHDNYIGTIAKEVHSRVVAHFAKRYGKGETALARLSYPELIFKLSELVGLPVKKPERIVSRQKARQSRGRLSGLGASKGRAAGVALVVRHGSSIDAVHESREKIILVTRMTTPDMAGVLSKVAGIITDQGGSLSHAAIVAREFNIPCIVGAENATNKIKTGQQVRMDGESGLIQLSK